MPARPPDLSKIQAEQDADWRIAALCRGTWGSYPFFPNEWEDAKEHRERENRAKRICSNCPSQKECLDFALEMRLPYGIYGGVTEKERRRMLKARDRLAKSQSSKAS